MNLFGNCVVCGKHLGAAEYDRQEVIAMASLDSSIVLCVKHVDGGEKNPEYKTALEKIALAKVAQLQGKN